MERLRVGIIGLGVGEKHIEAYQRHPGCEVVALCDFSSEKLSAIGSKYPGIPLTDKADDLLQDPDIDVVSIASYDNYHYDRKRPHTIPAMITVPHVDVLVLKYSFFFSLIKT